MYVAGIDQCTAVLDYRYLQVRHHLSTIDKHSYCQFIVVTTDHY